MTSITTEDIAKRRAELQKELAHLEGQIGELHTELSELDVFDRFVKKFKAQNAGARPRKVSSRSNGNREEAKPSLPSLRDMIITVLQKAKAEGRSGLKPKEIATLIAQEFSPTINPDSVNSIAWTMWKRNLLVREDHDYMLPGTLAQ